MRQSNQLIVDLCISAEEYLRLYRGEAEVVYARARDGRSVRFPANILRRFVSREGVQGAFQLRFDDRGRLLHIERV